MQKNMGKTRDNNERRHKVQIFKYLEKWKNVAELKEKALKRFIFKLTHKDYNYILLGLRKLRNWSLTYKIYQKCYHLSRALSIADKIYDSTKKIYYRLLKKVTHRNSWVKKIVDNMIRYTAIDPHISLWRLRLGGYIHYFSFHIIYLFFLNNK